jgi:hypothetical protein
MENASDTEAKTHYSAFEDYSIGAHSQNEIVSTPSSFPI